MGVILGLLFAVLMLGAAALSVLWLKPDRKSDKRKVRKNKLGGYLSGAFAVVMLVLFIFIPFGFTQVDTGEIAIVKVWGEAKEIKTSGLHFRNVVSTKYEIYDIKTQQMDVDNEVYTKDAQPLEIQLTLHYSIQADKAMEINRTYGVMSVLAQRIEKVAVEKSKVVLSAKTAFELIETRAQISPDVFAEIKTIENQYYINIENVVIVDMAFSAAFEQSVEERMIAQQEVIKAEAEKEKAIIKAEQDLAVSKLQAEQALAKAKGDADALIEAARGEAQALKLKTVEVARMLGFEVDVTLDVDGLIDGYVIKLDNRNQQDIELISEYLMYIAYLEKWDGKLPEVVMDGGSIIIPMP